MVVEDCDPAPEEEEAAPTPPPVVVVPESGIRREDYETGDWYHGMFNGALREGKGLYVYAQGPIKEFEGDFKGGWGHGLGRFKCAPLPLPEWQREETWGAPAGCLFGGELWKMPVSHRLRSIAITPRYHSTRTWPCAAYSNHSKIEHRGATTARLPHVCAGGAVVRCVGNGVCSDDTKVANRNVVSGGRMVLERWRIPTLTAHVYM